MSASASDRWVRKTWIVVADESAAEIYSQLGRKDSLVAKIALTNAASRQKQRDINSDRAGRSFDSHGQGRHALTKQVGPKEQASQRFAHDVAHYVADGIMRKEAHSYILVAAPRFLGLLRKEFVKLCPQEPLLTIDKEVVGQPAATVAELIEKHRR